jgi:small GTP-binding protein
MNRKIKVVMLGEPNVGKSTLAYILTKNEYKKEIPATIGASFSIQNIYIERMKEMISVHLWDTAGQEKFRSLVSFYFRGANIFVIVFDISNIKTWDAVDYWYQQILNYDSNPLCILIGNKSDQEHQITLEQISIKAKHLKAEYYIVSATSSQTQNILINMFKKTTLQYFEQNNLIQEQPHIILAPPRKYLWSRNC